MKNAKGMLGRFTRDFESCDLLVANELGFLPLRCHAAGLLLQVTASCHRRRSVAIIMNLGFGRWNTVVDDSRLTAALIDRLVHRGHALVFIRGSYRLRNAPLNCRHAMILEAPILSKTLFTKMTGPYEALKSDSRRGG